MSLGIARKQNILVTDSSLLKLLLNVFGFGSQAFVRGFSRQNICSVGIWVFWPNGTRHPKFSGPDWIQTYIFKHLTIQINKIFLSLKVWRPGRKMSGFRTARILKICQTSGPDVMSGRALEDICPIVLSFPTPLSMLLIPWNPIKLSFSHSLSFVTRTSCSKWGWLHVITVRSSVLFAYFTTP